jgi:hypothetical protein
MSQQQRYRVKTHFIGVLLICWSLLSLLFDHSPAFNSSAASCWKNVMSATSLMSNNATRSSHSNKTSGTLATEKIPPQQLLNKEPADAYLEGWPLQLVQNQQPPYSRVQCVAENFQADTAWMYRSCHYTNLCFDLTEKVFALHPSPLHQQLDYDIMQRTAKTKASQQHQDENTFLSSTSKDLMGGGAHAMWLKQGRGKWKPALRNASSSNNYYTLHAVWISFFPINACNAGHNLWDVFLPIYTLLE